MINVDHENGMIHLDKSKVHISPFHYCARYRCLSNKLSADFMRRTTCLTNTARIEFYKY
jgi:hypothetical protein